MKKFIWTIFWFLLLMNFSSGLYGQNRTVDTVSREVSEQAQRERDSIDAVVIRRQGIDSIKENDLKNIGVNFEHPRAQDIKTMSFFSEVVIKGRMKKTVAATAPQGRGKMSRSQISTVSDRQPISIEVVKIYKNVSLRDTTIHKDFHVGAFIQAYNINHAGTPRERHRKGVDDSAGSDGVEEGLFFLDYMNGNGGFTIRNIFKIDDMGTIGYYDKDDTSPKLKYKKGSFDLVEQQIRDVTAIIERN